MTPLGQNGNGPIAESTTHSLADGKIFALTHPYELDGRASSHPVDARGHTTMNCYLLVEDRHALLYSTGYSVHEHALLTQLEALVGARRLSLAISRVEFPAMCNARPISDRFDLEWIHHRFVVSTIPESLNIRPEFAQDATDGLRRAKSGLISTRAGSTILVTPSAERRLEFFLPELRLLPNPWAYDEETRTMLTGDIFAWVWHDDQDGPWLIDETTADPTTAERVSDFLLHNRYWWLAGAATDGIRASLAKMFEQYDVDTLAPDHGAVITGGAVARHYELLDRCLAEASKMPAAGLAVESWAQKARE